MLGNALGKSAKHIPSSNVCSDCHTSLTTWKGAKFDHNNPGAVGVACQICHDGTTATGKANTHILTLNTCASCHVNTSWLVPAKSVDHTAVIGTCMSCHDNGHNTTSFAPITGKTTTHFSSSDLCASCHTTVSWKPAVLPLDHTQLFGTCFSCHDGKLATGRSNAHVGTSTDCVLCHNTIAWTGANVKFDHTDPVVAGATCISCHTGTNPLAFGKINANPTHIASSDNCSDCHTTIAFKPAHIDHSDPLVVAQPCSNCHDGNHPPAIGKPNTHIPTPTGSDCKDCHDTVSFLTSTKPDHSQPGFAGNCFSCHNSKAAKGKTPTHFLTSNTCDLCHNTTLFKPATFDHADTALAGVACSTCHDSAPVHLPALGKTSAPGGHLPTSDTCENCHAGFTTWVTTAKFPHDDAVAVVTPCVTCHDGNHLPAVGKAQTHFAASSDCATCHVTTAWTVAIGKFNHADPVASGVPCFTCHDGSRAPALGKNTGHVASSNVCSSCHTTVAWKPAKFDHTDPVVAGATCVSCHNGTNPLAFGKINASPTHITSTDNCSDCHTTIAFKPAHIDHSDPLVVAQKCSACHDGAHPPAIGKSPTHIPTPTGSDCKDCHGTVTFLTSLKPDHSQPGFAGNCFSCHNTVAAKGKPQTHFLTSNTCDLCHNTTLFKPATFDHNDGQVVGKACFACHDGAPGHAPALGKSSAAGGHLPTSNTCENCHAGFTTWVTTIKFPHDDAVAAVTPCVTCHDGNHAPAVGKLGTHFQTSNDCGSCHLTTVWTVGVGKFNHADPVSIGVPCFTCHTGNKLPAVGKIQGHVTSSNICGDCHSTVAWKPAGFDHATVVPGTCFTCHNGIKATGKSQTHLATSNTCDNCHGTTVWKPAKTPFDHADPVVAGAKCYTCHDGAHLPAVPKSAKHIASTTACELCHVTANWTVALNSVDHTQVIGTCFTCHNGTFATPSRTITPKTPTHFVTTNTCEACHKTSAWKPVAATAFDHTQAPGACNSCHDGAHAPAVGKTLTHIKSTVLCDSCHTTIAWKPVPANKVDHTQVVGTCFSCHNGTIATGRSAKHINTSTTCDACHNTVSWVSIAVDHTQVIGTCFTCHNATIATGKVTFGPHFNTTNTCDACHTSKDIKTPAAANWTVVKTAFDHSQAIGACATCHIATAKPAAVDVKSATHFITTQPCESCHNTVTWLTLLPYSHTSPAYVLHYFGTTTATCITCHKQNNEKITYKSPGLFPDCASCHSDKYSPDPHNKYGNVRYTFTELRDCTGACHVYTDATLTKIQSNRATNPKHRPSRNAWN